MKSLVISGAIQLILIKLTILLKCINNKFSQIFLLIFQFGVTPLVDNFVDDTYYYLVTVYTGMKRGAGTKSRIGFIVHGKDEDTGIRELSDGLRSVSLFSLFKTVKFSHFTLFSYMIHGFDSIMIQSHYPVYAPYLALSGFDANHTYFKIENENGMCR